MVRIRLRRVGPKKQPSYRVVVIDRKKARDSRYIESIGFYNPRTEPATMTLQEDRALYWLSVGAQPSDAVEHILRQLGTTERFSRLRGGEDMEKLVAEAEAALEAAAPVSGKTRFPAPAKSARKVDDAVTEVEAAVAADEAEESEDEAEVAEVEEAAEEAEAEVKAEVAEVEEVAEEAEAEVEAEVAEVEEVAEEQAEEAEPEAEVEAEDEPEED
jgi:small subunit ribosomal protein S16